MILANKFIPYNKTIAVSTIEILEFILKVQECSFLSIHKNTTLTTTEIIDGLDFLYAIGQIEYKEKMICLRK